MNSRNILNILLATLIALSVWSCNLDDTEEVYISADYSNVSVLSFSLGKDDSILQYLDTVFFSVDLDNARIFNADSLPVGTKINKKLTVNISLPSVSKAMLYFNGTEGRDSVDYLTSSTDSVDFTNGPVLLRVVSLDATTARDYSIQINIHKMNPDSLEWSRAARRDLPTNIVDIRATKTVEWQSKYYCLTAGASSAEMAVAANLADDEWTVNESHLPDNARVETLAATTEALYILDSDNTLYRSVDGGIMWVSTGVSMSHIYGGYGDQLLGTVKYGATYVQLSYPDAVDASVAPALPAGCPVSGTSNTLLYTTEWSEYPMLMMNGGRMADGSLTGASWAYDGKQWANISIDPALAREGVSLIPYFAFKTSAYWVVNSYSVLLAVGGSTLSSNRNTVYISYDKGVHWAVAMESLQLPDYIPGFADASALIGTSVLGSRSSSAWTSLEPKGTMIVPQSLPAGRASQLITQWECPYIYLFGGVTFEGQTMNQVWRGAINRLTFRPLQ